MTTSNVYPPVTSLGNGEEGIIHAIAGGHALISRLAGMGIVLNTTIRFLHASGGLVIVQVADTRVALGTGEAAKILVRRLPREEKALRPQSRALLVALAGQPNAGKSTVFNILTGLSQHVGNWPGKTVEKKEGAHAADGVEMRIVDLPGTYSLTAFSEEEKIAREFVIHEAPDLIVLLVNAAALERSLYLLAEILLLGSPVIVALNMLDVAEAQGIRVDAEALEKALGLPVVPMVATKNRGIRELVQRIISVSRGEAKPRPKLPRVREDHRKLFEELTTLIRDAVRPPYTTPWVAAKLMEGDPEISAMMEGLAPAPVWGQIRSLLIAHEDSLHAVVCGRYDWVEKVTRACVSRFRMGQVVMTDRIDHVLTRPAFGIPVLLAVLGCVFFLTYQVGFPLQKLLEGLVRGFTAGIEPLLTTAPDWLRGLLIDGVIGGVGSVLTFLPILLLFFATLAFLEDVGYMARAAFVMDRFMHLVGLHGKSFIPMCLGFGCTVPAIIGVRIIESKRARLLTILLTPFVPCTARLAVLTFITAAIFAADATIIVWSLVALNILILGATGMVVHAFLTKEEATPFIMELPLYHRPDPRTILNVIRSRTVAFVQRAGTVILTVSVLVWLLSYFPTGQTESSFLAGIGRFIEPLGRPLGLDWKMMTALLTSLVAKENAVATLGVLYGVGEQGLLQTLPSVMSHASALSFLTVVMLFVPCAATIAIMRREMADRLWFISSLVLTFVVSYLGGMAAYRIALWTGL
ncbi:MAG: ferrous iron transport protein B [Proteobacteria bacterium]|nr:ferrous iron transport protein B [Pseudomonadota bacterium]MCG2741658.1 ferrous iron transport protein B [Syntrophaceae bacterium]MBU1745234.1 ferrous iron transport protein B [Pseudomonadota bacterium]MBU1966037.1 ferrous iron transport protein B [Pseudomonadota bacterium]MBU4372211.1 ferrous iron transport protein B [Pseudomonadota bacterium]